MAYLRQTDCHNSHPRSLHSNRILALFSIVTLKLLSTQPSRKTLPTNKVDKMKYNLFIIPDLKISILFFFYKEVASQLSITVKYANPKFSSLKLQLYFLMILWVSSLG